MDNPVQTGKHRASAAPTGTLLSDEPTVELILKARDGDHLALEAILQRCLPALKRWAHGRLPAYARGSLDTEDLVQDAAFNAVRRLDTFQPQHVGALQAYLRRSVINRIRDEIRKLGAHPAPQALPEDLQSSDTSPLEQAIQLESYELYRAALKRLRSKDREILMARLEAQWSVAEVADRFGFSTPDAARVATIRAMERLMAAMNAERSARPE